MEFTGERYIPKLDWPEVSYEHWHRYIFASKFVNNKRILDIACGEGYGSYFLSQTANMVVGVDIDLQTIEHATKTYHRDNLKYILGSANSFPFLGEKEFDGVVCFETIEHISEEQQYSFLKEVKRILKPDGFLLISTPNKHTYTDIPNVRNPFHIKEFYKTEFIEFLSDEFSHIQILGQRIYPASFIWNEDNISAVNEYVIEFSEKGFSPSVEKKSELYFVAFCSNVIQDKISSSHLVDLSNRAIAFRDEQIQSLINNQQLLLAQVAEKDKALSAQVEEKETAVQALSAQVEEKETAVQALSAQVEEKERKLSEIYQSRAWRMVMFLRNIGLTKQSQEEKYLTLLRDSELFDESWYLSNNPDVSEANVDPSRHYLIFGGFEGRKPSPHFNSDWYLGKYEDVRHAKINPLIHYLLYGKAEQRLPLPPDQNTINEHDEQSMSFLPAQTPAPSSKYRNKDWHHFLRESIKMSLGVFDRSKRAKIIYHLKNYGPVSLIKTINGTLKESLEESKNGNQQFPFDAILSPVESNDVSIRQWAEYNAKAKLRVFFKSNARLEFPVPVAQPMVSIILLFHNRAEMSLQCLETLATGAGNIPFEVVIVDNASTDETSVLLDRIRNAKIVRNSTNSGFGGGCNQAVDLAVGKYLLFLNNDTQLLPNSLKIMIDTLEGGANIGAIGGKLIFPDGRLQEAGSIIWRDASCAGYGRYDDPFKPEFSYVKDVDFCSGALLLTPRDLFLSLGKFDPRYSPAYYEDADYCLHLWNKGYRVVFQPFAVAVHYEFGSSGMTNAIALQMTNREKFAQKWQDDLTSFYFPEPSNIIFSREHKTDSKRILFIDDRIPDYRLGSGYPRTYAMLQMLVEMGYRLTFFPMQTPLLIPEIAQLLQKMGIEVLYKEIDQKINFEAFLKSRQNYYDIAIVSRPHNMQDAIEHLKTHAKQTAIVYDAEAIFALRDIEFDKLNGKRMTDAEKEKLIQTEVTLIKDANVVTTVSEMEREQFIKHEAPSIQILGHIIEPKPTLAAFEERKDVLFVGSILGCPSPNEDAVRYFVDQILPLVRQEVNCELYIVGTNRVKAIWDLESDYIHVMGKVDDLVSYYNRCRLFVVPTRYSAGISLKLLEASAYGLPAVVTPLTAKQLAWQENRDILVGYDPVDFARKVIDLYTNRNLFYSLRQNALDRIQEEYSPEHFRKNLEHVISVAIDRKKEQETI